MMQIFRGFSLRTRLARFSMREGLPLQGEVRSQTPGERIGQRRARFSCPSGRDMTQDNRCARLSAPGHRAAGRSSARSGQDSEDRSWPRQSMSPGHGVSAHGRQPLGGQDCPDHKKEDTRPRHRTWRVQRAFTPTRAGRRAASATGIALSGSERALRMRNRSRGRPSRRSARRAACERVRDVPLSLSGWVLVQSTTLIGACFRGSWSRHPGAGS